MQNVFFDPDAIKEEINNIGPTKKKTTYICKLKKILITSIKTGVREDDNITFHGQLREEKL